MATIKAVILKRIDKAGLTTVQIAISHHSKTTYISTKIKVDPKDFIGGQIIRGNDFQAKNMEILSLVKMYNDRLKTIDHVDAKDVLQLRNALETNRGNKYHKVSECFQAYMDTLNSVASKESYKTSWKCFKEFCKEHDVNIESVDRNFVEKYYNWLQAYTPIRTQRRSKDYGMRYRISKQHPTKEHYSQSTVSTYMAHLKAVINYTIDEGWVRFSVHPFARISIKRGNTRANILSAESLKKIKNYVTDNPRYQRCIDMFMLQFYLGGPNIADIMKMDFRTDEITYERQKISSRTNGKAFVTIPIIPQAREIVNKYMDKETGLIKFGKEQSIRNLTSDFNYCIKCVAIDLGIKEYVTFTSARKCFAQIGMNLGFSDNYINYLLGHSMSKARGMLDPYSKVQTELAAEILRVIAEFVDHPEEITKIFKNNIQKMLLSIRQ